MRPTALEIADVSNMCVDETWIRGEKMLPGAEGDPEMPCQR